MSGLTIKLTYFKESGKFYTSAEYLTSRTEFYDIVQEMRDHLARGTLPGLSPGADEFSVLVQVPMHPLEDGDHLPHLLVPEKFRKPPAPKEIIIWHCPSCDRECDANDCSVCPNCGTPRGDS